MALLLGVVGLYGVIALFRDAANWEIGVRMALGVQRGSVYQLIMKEAGWLAGIGIVAGLLCSIGAAALMRGFAVWSAGVGRGDADRRFCCAGGVCAARQLRSGLRAVQRRSIRWWRCAANRRNLE